MNLSYKTGFTSFTHLQLFDIQIVNVKLERFLKIHKFHKRKFR